jgi:hypothetical protein
MGMHPIGFHQKLYLKIRGTMVINGTDGKTVTEKRKGKVT